METNLNEITVNLDNNLKDIIFSISGFKTDIFNDYEIIARSLYKQKIVGMKIIIRNNIKPGIVNGKIQADLATKGGVQFKSIGKESDLLIAAICELYNQPKKGNFTIRSVVSNCVVFVSKDFDINTDKIKLQLTFDPENKKQLLSEIFMDVDVQKKTIILAEKDQEWRKNIVEILTT